MRCSLTYIPKRLHTNKKPIVNKFSVGERLFYRCKKGVERPYDSISLYDISHNRCFNFSENFKADDVLFNIIPEDANERYETGFIQLTIKEVCNKENTFVKKFSINQDSGIIEAEIRLIHAPVPCMYSHSAFEISLQKTIVNEFNYKKTLGKRSKTFKNLRSDIRQIITSMIQTGNITNNDIEIITEL